VAVIRLTFAPRGDNSELFSNLGLALGAKLQSDWHTRAGKLRLGTQKESWLQL
jgi:hypothetical protein